jgi:hypothetical protein
MPKVKLTGVAMVTFTRTINVPADEIEEFIDACDEDGGNIECNLDPDDEFDTRREIGSWEFLDYEVLG